MNFTESVHGFHFPFLQRGHPEVGYFTSPFIVNNDISAFQVAVIT